ncbi:MULTISPECIES: response regulator [Olivibacter]|uniref:Response regulator n=1 Tax=Olivibacter jilunii TaxID=985016 RepID=A0ABW6AWF9_9SPHI|nr:response regulator [Olivibacter sp. UJ_SKK_5.1]MDX3914382.1 response regulator [Pseudosphingobacterium sp.]
MEENKTSELRILFAEDNEVNRFYLRSLFEQHFKGMLILEAKNGREAVEIYEAYRPNLVLLDLNMPIMGGNEAAVTIKQLAETNGDKPRIIALTGNSLNVDDEAHNQEAIDDYIIKPFTAEALLTLLSPVIVDGKNIEESTDNLEITIEGDILHDKRHFNYEELERSLANDRQLINEVLTYVLNSLDTFLPRFRNLITEGNQEQIQKLAHELRGTALNARLPLLSEYALLLENQASFDEDFLLEHLKRIDEEIKDVKPLLAAMLD